MSKPSVNSVKKASKRRFYKRKGFWFMFLLLSAAFGAIGWTGFLEFTRPYRERAETFELDDINKLETPSIIMDRNGEEIGRVYVENRSVIPYEEIPQTLIDALCAGEDSRFWTHDGVDYIGILRAAYLNFKSGETDSGASTVTQQLARNAYDLKGQALKRKESGYQRKLVEVFLARRIEKRYRKTEILDYYLNRIYFGSGFYGIRSAALGYFGKEPKDLTTEECASIVGLIKNPTGISPFNNIEKNRISRNHVLDRMREEGSLTAAEAARLKATEVVLNPKPLQRGTTHFYERVVDEIRNQLGDDALLGGGFRIHTTIYAPAQQAAQKALAESLAKAEAHPGYSHPKYEASRKVNERALAVLQGSVLMVDHSNGEVLAYVGGRDYAQVPYDFIEQGRRPLGTAFFPFLYAAGFASGLTPATMMDDTEMDNRAVMVGGSEGIVGEWGMEIDNPVYEYKKIPARRAFENSKIAASVRFGTMFGLPKVVAAAKAFGFTMPKTEDQMLPRIFLGWETVSMPEVVRAISAFARGGEMGPKKLHFVDSVEDASGHVVYPRSGTQDPRAAAMEKRVQVVDPSTAYQIHHLMSGSMQRGSAAGVLDQLKQKPFYGAGKTGTTHDMADVWFLGYNNRVSCGVWAGYLQNHGKPIYQGAFSRDIAMPVWAAAMNAITNLYPSTEVRQPSNIVEVPVCRTSGQRATQFCYEMAPDPATGQSRARSAAVIEYFRRGTDQLPFCPDHSGATQGVTPGSAMTDLPSLDAVAVRPKAPALIGNDPYHADQPSTETPPPSTAPGMIHRRTNVLDSLDLGDPKEKIPVPKPPKLNIETE